jgi:ferrochelatase
MSKKAILLINLGTPHHCDGKSVRRYLREFLNDPRVIDLPAIIRWPLVNLFIIPFRYRRTTAAYQKIWTKQGSPLLVISEKIREKLAGMLGQEYQVELGMRYGSPSIASALDKMKDCESLTVIPLFPQYSSAATGSALEAVLSVVRQRWNIPALHIVRDFYQHPAFIAANAEIIKSQLQGKKIDKIIFSYHGLPERHITKSDCAANCDHLHACPLVSDANRFCYRAQCYATTQAIAESLQLTPDQYLVSFQSRLGRTPWIKPYTDFILPELVQHGVRNIAVVSPSFVADCLETLEEIDIRMRRHWEELGGSAFVFIPCVNASDVWVSALNSFSSRHVQ